MRHMHLLALEARAYIYYSTPEINLLNVTGFAKTVPNRTRIEIPFIAWHES